jgi:hypothetical protein
VAEHSIIEEVFIGLNLEGKDEAAVVGRKAARAFTSGSWTTAQLES